MSVKIIACLNPVTSERTVLESGSGQIKDIINNINSGFPLSQARVCRNGEIIKDFSIMAQDGDTLTIKFVPYGTEETGIGMKIGGWALAVVGIIVGVATSWTGIGAFFGSALIGAGIGMISGGTVLLNIDIPTLSDREKPENDPSVRGGKNQPRPHGRIPVLFGRHRIYPDLAANPHTEIIDNQQYYTQLFCGGYKDYIIDNGSFKLGETPLIELSHTGSITQILSGADPVIRIEILQNGEVSNIYPNCVHEDVINAPLQNQIDSAGGSISGAVIRTTPDNTDKINVDIFFHNGMGSYDSEGNLGYASVEAAAFYKPADSDDSQYQSLGFFNDTTNEISLAELRTKRYQVTKSGLAPGQYTIKIVRVTEDSSDSKVIDQVYVGSIRSIKSNRPIRTERQKDLTIIALRVMATAKINGVIDSFNYVATSKLPVHSPNGSGPLYWLNTMQTRNPAAALLYALRGRAAQQTVDPDDVDWLSIEAFYAWCEDHNYTCNAYLSESVTIAELMRMIGKTARADILRIDSKISVVQDIERPSPVQLFTPKNTVNYSVTMFSADVPDAISLRYIDENAGFAHNELPVYNTPDGNPQDKPAETIQKVDLWGITDDIQARRIGMYNYACIKNRPFIHNIDVDIEYLLCNKGDRVNYAGDIALTGSVQGRIKGIIFFEGLCAGIDTDEPVVMEPGKQYAVRIRKSDSTIIIKDVVFNPGIRREKSITYYPGEGGELYEPFIGDMFAVDEDNVYYEPQNIILFSNPLDEIDVPKAGDIYAFGVRGYEVIDLIITDIQPGANLTASLACVEYSPEIFNVDKPDFILPAFENKITPVSGAVDSGVVNSNRWRLFAVFNDSEDEPARPAGNGQNNGWYQAQTFRSVWQSTKIAEAVDTGEWGLPVRIKAERGTDDITPVWLSLTPQNITLETDSNGNVLAGLLPLTIQARLFQWNAVLQDVLFSLVNAPEGVSINADGLITVNDGASLRDTNNITVRAEYQNGRYSNSLFITKSFNSSAPRYLGTINELSESSNIMIIKGPVQGQVQARQSDYVLAVSPAGGRQAGSVFQWTGVVWEYRAPEVYSDLYIRCFKDGLDVLVSVDGVEWFGTAITRLLVAQRAFIETLEAQILKISGVIYSGDRFNAAGEVVNTNATGWHLGSNGILKAYNGVFEGRIDARDGYLNNVTIGNEAVVLGTIKSGPVFISNETTNPIAPYTFTAGTYIRDVVWGIGANKTINMSIGSYAGKNDLIQVITTHETFATNYLYTLKLIFKSGNVVSFRVDNFYSNNWYDKLPQTLSMGGHLSGKVFIIENLPTSPTGLPEGSVYRNGNQLMIA